MRELRWHYNPLTFVWAARTIHGAACAMCIDFARGNMQRVWVAITAATWQPDVITGHSKKGVSRAVHLFFVGIHCCFILTWCISNVWKYDLWHLRCLLYQVESILFHFEQLQNIFFQEFPWNTAKMFKNLQCLKTLQICYLRHAEHHAKNRTSLRSLDHDRLFFEWPVMKSSAR